MNNIVPNVTGISELQRFGKKAIEPVLNNISSEPVFLADRNNLFAVILSIKDYEQLVEKSKNDESKFWLNASQTSLDFWDHPSNDIYEQLL